MRTTLLIICLLLGVAPCASARAQDEAVHRLDDFYRSDEVQDVHLEIADENWRKMIAALPKRIYVPASFRWRDVTYDKVAVRFKGNSSSRPNQPFKRSFLVKFDEYDPNGQFLGMRRVSFDNGIQFGSLFSEPIITEILRDLGVITHRSNYAKIFVNGDFRGVYVNVERIDETFIRRYLPDPQGALFKVDEGGPGCNLGYLGEDLELYKKAFEAKSANAEKTRPKLVELMKMIKEAEKDEFAAKLEESLELDDFLRTAAVMLFSGAFDQLTGYQPHNYYFYFDRKSQRWRYLPWDLDVGFSETAFGRLRVLEDWNAAWPITPSRFESPLFERILDDPALLSKYRRSAREILDKYFEADRLCKIVDAKYALIKEDLAADPFPHVRITNPTVRGYDDIVNSIQVFIRKRYASADKQLKSPGPRPKLQRPVGPPPGLPPHIVAKIRRVEKGAHKMRREGKSIRPVQQVMEKVGPLLQQKKVKEAMELLDQALRLVGEDPNESPGKDPSKDSNQDSKSGKGKDPGEDQETSDRPRKEPARETPA